jgi:hypothetical protein
MNWAERTTSIFSQTFLHPVAARSHYCATAASFLTFIQCEFTSAVFSRGFTNSVPRAALLMVGGLRDARTLKGSYDFAVAAACEHRIVLGILGFVHDHRAVILRGFRATAPAAYTNGVQANSALAASKTLFMVEFPSLTFVEVTSDASPHYR